MKIKSKELLDQLGKVTETHIRKAISLYQNMEDEQMLKPAPDGGWSIAQCLDHLNGYGDVYFPKMRKAMEHITKASDEYRSTWLRDKFTKSLDPDTGKMKMKACKGHRPELNLDAAAVVEKFIRQQEDFLGMMNIARQRDLTRIRIPTSIASWIRMNLGDTFRFIVAHNERHIRQADRLIPAHSMAEK
jgi:hypothetical protein